METGIHDMIQKRNTDFHAAWNSMKQHENQIQIQKLTNEHLAQLQEFIFTGSSEHLAQLYMTNEKKGTQIFMLHGTA